MVTRERVLAVFRPTNIRCDVCGGSAIPAHFEIVVNPKRPSEIVDLFLWIDCPHCGPRKQPAPNFVDDESTTDTVEDIPVLRQSELHDPKRSGSDRPSKQN
jgi:hypothetical protein